MLQGLGWITDAGLQNNDLNPNNSFNTGFLSVMSGTSMAAPHVAGMGVLAQELALQELGRLLTPAEFRQLLGDTGNPIFDGDDEDDNVTNTERTYRRVNILTLANAILDLKPPSDRQIDLAAKSFATKFIPYFFGKLVFFHRALLLSHHQITAL